MPTARSGRLAGTDSRSKQRAWTGRHFLLQGAAQTIDAGRNEMNRERFVKAAAAEPTPLTSVPTPRRNSGSEPGNHREWRRPFREQRNQSVRPEQRYLLLHPGHSGWTSISLIPERPGKNAHVRSSQTSGSAARYTTPDALRILSNLSIRRFVNNSGRFEKE